MIAIEKKNGVVEEMTVDEFSRWMCLMEAFHFIETKAKEMKIDVSNMIKPLAIESYIKERFFSMKHDIECEISLGHL